jgi:hypothetical protein
MVISGITLWRAEGVQVFAIAGKAWCCQAHPLYRGLGGFPQFPV